MSNFFGKAKIGNSSGPAYKNYKMPTDKAGGKVVYKFRILPPMKSLAESGRWHSYHAIHFGYAGNDKQTPGKAKIRPFRCIEERNYRTKMVTQSCPECEKIKAQEQLLDNMVARAKAAGKTEQDIDLMTAPLRQWLRDHNLDKKFYVAVFNEAMEPGVLSMSGRVKKALEEKAKELQLSGIDPFDPAQGVWFNFVRVGRQKDVQDSVEVAMIQNGRSMEIQPAPLTEEQCRLAFEAIPDLTTLSRLITREQMQMLVNSGGDLDEVDAILEAGVREGSARSPSSPAVRAAPAPTLTATPAPAPAAPANDAAAQIAALQAQLAAAQAAVAAANGAQATAPNTTTTAEDTPVVLAPATTVTATANQPLSAELDTSKMSNEDFLKLFSQVTRTGQ